MVQFLQFPVKRKQPSFINRRYMAFYLARQKIWLMAGLMIAVISFIFSTVLGIIQLYDPALPRWPFLFSLVSLLVSFGSFIVGLLKIKKEIQEMEMVPKFDPLEFEQFLDQVQLSKNLSNAGYEIVKGGFGKNIFTGDTFQGASATSPLVNRLLWDLEPNDLAGKVPSASQTIWGYKLWPIPILSQQLLPTTLKMIWKNHTLANENKVRLTQDLVPSRTLKEIQIEKTDYLSDLVTGQLTGTQMADWLGKDPR